MEVVATTDHKSMRPDHGVFHRTSLALLSSKGVQKLLLHHLHSCLKMCFPKAFETMVLLPEADTVMERVVVVFFKGVFLTSPFLA